MPAPTRFSVLPLAILLSPALPCPALPCPALPCPALPCPALPCPAPSCPAPSWLPSPWPSAPRALAGFAVTSPCPPHRCQDGARQSGQHRPGRCDKPSRVVLCTGGQRQLLFPAEAQGGCRCTAAGRTLLPGSPAPPGGDST